MDSRMSSVSRASYNPTRRLGSVQSVQSTDDGRRRSRAASRARAPQPTYDDAYTFALRIAFLHYLLQPRKKRKEYVSTPKQPMKVHTSSVGDLMKEFVPPSSSNIKLPHSFRASLEKRMQGVLIGRERLPGYNDAAVKRTFGEAYTAFTAKDFQKSVDKDRKIEPLVLIFYTSATKAQGRGKAPEDNAWKLLVDRHLALFVRLVADVLREHGDDRNRPDLMRALQTLENKLLTNDQNLYIDTGQDGDHTTVEVEIPLSYEIKDMPMVQIVAQIFGLTLSQVQADIDSNLTFWTEEAALRDLKMYQHRLNSGMPGALRRQDFDVDDAFDEWKKNESPHLSKMMLDILMVKPDLAKSTMGYDKPLPGRPQSMYEDQAYTELSKMLSNPEMGGLGLDQSLSLSNLNLDDVTNIKSFDEPNYIFIPPDSRAFYKTILQYAMSFDLMHGDPNEGSIFSAQTLDLLNELAVHWRIPQFSRLVMVVEVATRKFLDQEIGVEQLDSAFEFVKKAPPETKRAPHIQYYSLPLTQIGTSRWTMQDYSLYQRSLREVFDALKRDLYNIMMRCYEPKPPSVGVVMFVLQNHIYEDSAFSPNPADESAFADYLAEGLKREAENVYRGYLESNVPQSENEWDFTHVVNLGKAVVGLCDRIKKRYRKNPEIMGVSPFVVLVKSMFPSFEEDAKAIIERVLQVAKDRDIEIELQDGFDLYKELVEIRKIHVESLPSQPFAFHVESLLDSFVWRWIRNAESRMEEFVESAIKQDNFQARASNPEATPTDAERHSHSIIDTFQLFNQTIDQVFQLEWDDDVHHAKFMTALAKAFAAGIGRYCEIVEAKFLKEMDRQTAQEIAAASKTTQEKFLQYAKDAWSTKEKIEPFQFYPESFIKLNNIEYAMQALDKLEKTANVDGCAEVLRNAEQPKQTKGPSKYVFTVKIVEAEDLKACDANGFSDPYVVLGDEYQKRLAKTRVVNKNLNPRWDESVDITVSGPINIIATIWDYDMIGDHDFVGRTSLKLDPKHFSDYLPREFWLDLDTQGRLLLRVSMEGERDDIQFYFGKAFRHLKRTERDMVRKITDKLTMHINVSLSHDALKLLLSRSITASIGNLWKKRQSTMPTLTSNDVENALQALFTYFNENFAIMKETLTDATMLSVMTRLWKEVLMAIEALLVPPLSEKPSSQKPLTQAELDVVFRWLELLFDFFHAKDEQGEVLGVPADILKSPKYHELASLNFFYFESTETLIRTSERMAAATAQRAQQQLQMANQGKHMSAPAAFGGQSSLAPPPSLGFASMGTIRRGKSILMSRNLGTMRRAKEEKRKEAQADPSDDMILRILRMRPEATNYLKERHRQKERFAAAQAAAVILRQSASQGWASSGPMFGGAQYGRNNLPRR